MLVTLGGRVSIFFPPFYEMLRGVRGRTPRAGDDGCVVCGHSPCLWGWVRVASPIYWRALVTGMPDSCCWEGSEGRCFLCRSDGGLSRFAIFVVVRYHSFYPGLRGGFGAFWVYGPREKGAVATTRG